MNADVPQQHLLIWGMMGVGKSTVGRAIAHRLQRPFVDLDEFVCRDTQQCVHELFAHLGESGFRRIERQGLETLLNGTDPLVIALGGGSLLEPSFREATRARSVVIGLSANLETLQNRLRDDTSRPLIAGDDREVRIRRLFHERATAYQSVDLVVENPDGELATTVERILAAIDKRERAA